jgi:hypothetical protein
LLLSAGVLYLDGPWDLKPSENRVAIYLAYYNLCRVHQTLKVTPAMESGLTDHIWSLEELVGPLEGNAQEAVA